MNTNRENLIAGLADELEPVRRITTRSGLLLLAFATLVAFGVSVAVFDFWSGMFEGEASPFFWVTNGLVLLLGLACTLALVVGGSPRVGQRQNAPGWAAAMVAILPIAAIISLIPGGHAHEGMNDPHAWYCTRASLAAALLVGVASVLWLRRGAPVSLNRSGWLVGTAAGALGTVAYGITCHIDSISHLGLWHVAPIAVSAVIGRLVVPPLIRW
ncbi:MAG: DUF1109 domain-containing protein [Pseudomonadota bacterium]